MEQLSKHLRVLRKEKGLTLADAGEQACIDLTALSRFETGCRVPTLPQLEKLALLYSTTVAEILNGRAITEVIPKKSG